MHTQEHDRDPDHDLGLMSQARTKPLLLQVLEMKQVEHEELKW
jgi:hypothetical protein